MPKWQLFPSLSLLAHVKEVRVRLHPGRVASEGCRQLASMLISSTTRSKYPGLQSRVEFLGFRQEGRHKMSPSTTQLLRYDAPSEVHIELNNGKKFRFACDGLSLKELHMRIDREQYQLYVEHIKEHAADATADDDG